VKNLKDLILDTAAPGERIDPFFSQYGLRHNPFPVNRTILPEVLYNQQPAITRFAEHFREILSAVPTRRALAVFAGTGGGKTHFLRHCRWNCETALKELSRRLVFVEFQAGSGKVQDVTREILGAADSYARSVGEENLVTALVKKISAQTTLLSGITQYDLRSALETLVAAYSPSYKPRDRAGIFNYEALGEVCRRWLNGATLTQTERKYLGVMSRIGTASYAVRVLTETLRLARQIKLFEGLVLSLDEIETIFTRGSSASQYQSFLQDLRYLYDESVKNQVGYSLFLLSASTPYGANLLRQVNYPVFQRLGFEEDQRVTLQPIADLEEAKLFAAEYVNFERQQFNGNMGSFPELLSETEIQQAFQLAAGPTIRGGKPNVNQAPLLDALHKLVEQKKTGAQLGS
jgi:hypothetical protein